MDKDTTFEQVKELIEEFVVERDWVQFHSPKNLSMAISIEAAELMDLFKWYDNDESIKKMNSEEFKDSAVEEIADIIIYSIAFANRNGIDISEAVSNKIKKNDIKYPASKFRGKF